VGIPFIAQADFFPENNGMGFDDLVFQRIIRGVERPGNKISPITKYRYDILSGPNIKPNPPYITRRVKVPLIYHRDYELTLSHLVAEPDRRHWTMIAAGTTASGEHIYFWSPLESDNKVICVPKLVIEELCAAGCVRVYCKDEIRKEFADLWTYQSAIYTKSLRSTPLDDQFLSGVYYHANIDVGEDDIRHWDKKIRARSKTNDEYYKRLRIVFDEILTGRKPTRGPRSIHRQHLIMMNNIKNRKLAIVITSTDFLFSRMATGCYPGNYVTDQIHNLYAAGQPGIAPEESLREYWNGLYHRALCESVGRKISSNVPWGGWFTPMSYLEEINYQT
jgi:hypothetical protein